jgi:hypothetical protein
MNVPLVAAALLAALATTIHGAAGEVLVVRKLSPQALPSTRIGSARMTKLMIHATWHITTLAFLTAAVAFLLSGTALDGDTARGVGMIGAAAFTGFAAVAMGLGIAYARSLRFLRVHPGPAVMSATAVLGWVGVLTL